MPSFALLAEHTTFALLVDESGKDKEVAMTNSMSPTHTTTHWSTTHMTSSDTKAFMPHAAHSWTASGGWHWRQMSSGMSRHATSARFARPDKSASHPLSTHPHPYSAKYTLTHCSCCMQEATGTLPKQGARSQLGWSGAHSG